MSGQDKVTSTLLVKNVSLPLSAYSGLDVVSGSLVDIEFKHQSSSSSLQVVVTASGCHDKFDSAGQFKPLTPFQSICDVRDRELQPQADLSRPPTGKIVLHQDIPASSQKDQTERGFNKVVDAKGSLAIPGGLCHAHVHLDKCYLLDRCKIEDGTFKEALVGTNEAKEKFTLQDLTQRGRRLITSSISHGVTCMRAHVEVDPTVKMLCVEAGIALKKEFEGRCDILLVAFAQDPLYYPQDKKRQTEMHQLMSEASKLPKISAVGSAPYVESGPPGLTGAEAKAAKIRYQQANIEKTFSLARENGKDLDFHLDYDLTPPSESESMLPHVIHTCKSMKWSVGGRMRRVTLGHCTKLSVFGERDLDTLVQLSEELSSDPDEEALSLVALPPSDLYMQGRDIPYGQRSRATMPVLDLAQKGMKAQFAMGVNNVGNLFTPQGDGDPLALLPMMVGVWQCSTQCERLLHSVTKDARFAAGVNQASTWKDLVILDGAFSVQDAVLSPPYSRITIKDGHVVSHRKVDSTVF